MFGAVKAFLAQETADKITLTGRMDPEDLTSQYHPCQLEKKFGGEAESPTNYWPPYVGPEFYPDGDKSHLDLIEEVDYPSVLRENPEFDVHPEYLANV